jgi:hypothetical protein
LSIAARREFFGMVISAGTENRVAVRSSFFIALFYVGWLLSGAAESGNARSVRACCGVYPGTAREGMLLRSIRTAENAWRCREKFHPAGRLFTGSS